MSANALVPASVTSDAAKLFVGFQVNGVSYALPADAVVQMETYTGATPVPGTQRFVAGIVQLRGRIIPVIDLRARFDLPPIERTLDTRVIVGELAGRHVAVVADSAREVLRIAPSQEKAPPRLVELGARGFIRSVAQLGDRTVMILDFAKLIGEEPIDV